jgi:hypothetical protein
MRLRKHHGAASARGGGFGATEGAKSSNLNDIAEAQATVCTADFGTPLGGNLCCAQPGKVVVLSNVCDKGAPYCAGFVQGVSMGE